MHAIVFTAFMYKSLEYITCVVFLILMINTEIVVLAIILVGLQCEFFIAIICGKTITEHRYHVLAKQELTKVGERKKTGNMKFVDRSSSQ